LVELSKIVLKKNQNKCTLEHNIGQHEIQSLVPQTLELNFSKEQIVDQPHLQDGSPNEKFIWKKIKSGKKPKQQDKDGVNTAEFDNSEVISGGTLG
jgi:hypothetical protein